MWVLYGVLRAVGGDAAQTSSSRQRADEARRAVLPMVVAAAQLVEVHPEVHIATVAVLHEVFILWGSAAQVQEAIRPAAVLLPWKTQLVVSLTTVLQHGLLSLEWCTALAVQYSRCNLADTSSCRRVLRSLLTLLHACLRLQDRQRGFLLGGSSGPGHIIVALAKVAQSPAMAAEMLEAAQGTFVRTLVSPPCQSALTLLCERFVTAVSLANGYVQSNSAFSGWERADDEGDDASATSSVYGARMSMTAGDVLQAIAFMTAKPLNATPGPALRYATGCLACLVLATLSSPAQTTRARSSAASDALGYVVSLSSQLTVHHQRILAQLAQQRLLTAVQSWGQLLKPHDEHTSNAEAMTASIWGDSTPLLRIAAVASMPRAQAEELLDAFTPYVEVADIRSTKSQWAEVAASLLCVGMAAKLELRHLQLLLKVLPADGLVQELLSPVVARLEKLATAYVQSAERDDVRVLALAGPTGLLLVGRCVSLGVLPATQSPLLDRQLWPAVLQLLCRASNPVNTLEYLWSPPADASADEPFTPVPLGACVEAHKTEASLILALLASLDVSSSSSSDSHLQEAAAAVLHCGPLLCGLLISKMKSVAATASLAESLLEVLRYVVLLLSTSLASAYAVALNEVGRYLVRTVAPAHGAALREAIHRLGAAKAAQLRVFMEESCN